MPSLIVISTGVHLDEQDEIDGTVDGIFSRIDSDKDSTLSLRDLSSYWDHFAATLTVEETVDWVVHRCMSPLISDVCRVS